MKFTRLTELLVGVVLALTMLPMIAFADSNYNIEAIKSDHQLDTKKSYFDLRVKPGEAFTIEIKINNDSDQTSQFKVTATNAKTNTALNINYDPSDETPDESLKHPFESIATVEEPSVEIPAKTSKVVAIKLQIPGEEFKGMILGGIYVSRELSDNEKKQSGYVNTFSYVKGVKLTESDDKATPDLKLLSAKATDVDHNVMVEARLQNPTATNIPLEKWEAKLTDKKTGKVIKEASQQNASIAPNTNFPYYLRFKKDELKSGSYRLTITATQSKDKQWVLTKDFDASVAEVKAVESKAQAGFELKGPVKDKDRTLLYAGIGASAALVLAGFWWLLAKRRKKGDQEQSTSRHAAKH